MGLIRTALRGGWRGMHFVYLRDIRQRQIWKTKENQSTKTHDSCFNEFRLPERTASGVRAGKRFATARGPGFSARADACRPPAHCLRRRRSSNCLGTVHSILRMSVANWLHKRVESDSGYTD